MLGLLGPNGAGKTTAISSSALAPCGPHAPCPMPCPIRGAMSGCITGEEAPQEGAVCINSEMAARSWIGLCPQAELGKWNETRRCKFQRMQPHVGEMDNWKTLGPYGAAYFGHIIAFACRQFHCFTMMYAGDSDKRILGKQYYKHYQLSNAEKFCWTSFKKHSLAPVFLSPSFSQPR